MSTAVKEKKKIDMINGPLVGGIIRFSLPIMATGILQHFYNAADIMVVGKFAGDIAQGAVSSTGALISVITNACIGLSVGGNVVVARMLGAKNQKGVHRAVHTAIALSLICGVAAALIGFFFAEYFLTLMACPPEMIGLSTLYVKLFILGAPVSMIYNFGSAILRASGDTKRPLIFLASSGLVNVGLNLVFVILFNMSVAGVAIATVISQFISAFLVITVLVREKSDIKLTLTKIRLHKNELRSIVRVGVPSSIQSVLFSLSNVIIQSSYNSFGEVAVSGVGVGCNIEGFVYLTMNAVYQAALTFVSQNYGAGNYKRLNKIMVRCIIITSVVGLFIGWLTIIFGQQLSGLYTNSQEVIDYAMERVVIISSTHFICGIMEVASAMLRGIDHSMFPLIVSVIGACGFRIAWIFTVFQWYRSLTTLYISYPITWILTTVTMFIGYAYFYRKMMKQRAESQQK